MPDMNVGFAVSDPRQGCEARNTRAEMIAAVDVCLAHDALDCVEYLVAPMHDSRMTAHKGRVITDGGKP